MRQIGVKEFTPEEAEMTGKYELRDEGALNYKRFLDGDEHAFDFIINTYHDSMIYFIYGILHNTADAEDVAADVFADLIVHKNRYSFQCSLKTYLFSVARNKAIDRLRRRKHTSDADFEETTASIADAEDLEEKVVSNELSQTIRSALEEINGDYAEVLRLTYIYGFSGDDISAVMGKSKKQIANLLYRGKESLRIVLEKKGGFIG